jgi:hypothetical protein
MFKIHFSKADYISPRNPNLRIESTIDCDGTECGRASYEDDGSFVELPPHWHLIESEDGAGLHIYGFGGDLPNESYDRSNHS